MKTENLSSVNFNGAIRFKKCNKIRNLAMEFAEKYGFENVAVCLDKNKISFGVFNPNIETDAIAFLRKAAGKDGYYKPEVASRAEFLKFARSTDVMA